VRDLRAFAQLKMVKDGLRRGYFAGDNPDGQKAYAGLLQWVVHVIKPRRSGDVYLERLFKEMRKGPVHLVFGVAVNKRYRTIFGMEKIDQGGVIATPIRVWQFRNF
jgi:hypothetical protein